MSDAIVKNLSFGSEARKNVFQGITKLTKAVSSTLGAGGKCVLLEDSTGKPVITKDGVTVADSVTLLDPVENMGATLFMLAVTIGADRDRGRLACAETAELIGTPIAPAFPEVRRAASVQRLLRLPSAALAGRPRRGVRRAAGKPACGDQDTER